MSYELRVMSYELRVRGIKKLILFLLLTFHFSLATVVNADELSSYAAVVMEASSGRILFAKNPDLRLPPASTVKLMTAIIVTERADLNKVITVSKKAVQQQPSKINLKKGERIKIVDLLYAALMESANDAATALAEAVGGSEKKFVRIMNRKAIEIGAFNTRYINANGLPAEGQYSTAHDIARIMQYAIRIPVIREVLGTRLKEISTLRGRDFFIRNTNELLWINSNPIEGKTGWTRLSRHCFVGVASKEDTGIIISLLGSPSREELWAETQRLFVKGFKILNGQEEPLIYTTITGD